MKLYATFGHQDFVLALGYLGEEIRRFFLHYQALTCDFTIELGRNGELRYFDNHSENEWRVTCIDTGDDAQTGTRVLRAARYVEDSVVMLTYGDGVGDVNIDALLAYHRKRGLLATVTAVQPPSRFGELVIGDDDLVKEFTEKPQTSTGVISGGFMVLQREAIDQYIPADSDVMLEREPLSRLAADGQLAAYRHDGFWQPMDTPREQQLLQELWDAQKAPWKVWK